MRIMGLETVIFLLWIYSPVAWDTYRGPMSAGWYVYDGYPTGISCVMMKERIREVQKDGGDALCRIDGYGTEPKPLAVLLKES